MTDGEPKSLDELLRVYAECPLDDGDVVLLLDDKVCVEIEQLAVGWDDVLRRNTASIVRKTSAQVVVLIARPDAVLRDSDYQLWRDLHADLRGSEVHLLPVRALPAAA